jgi:hypothetical protein
MTTSRTSRDRSAPAVKSYDPPRHGNTKSDNSNRFWLTVSPSDANWEAPYSARFHFGASAPRD